MGITLILTVCYLASPSDCHEERRFRDNDQPLTMSGCMVGGPQAGAEYVKENPEFQFRGWACQFGEKERI